MTSIHFISLKGGGTGEITDSLTDYLKKDFKVTKEGEYSEKDILLVHNVNLNLTKRARFFNSFKKRILIQHIDGISFKKIFVDELNKYDLIIVVSPQAKMLMETNGVTVPIKVIPLYYRPEELEVKPISKNKIIFYHESSFEARKGTDIIQEAFIRAFSDNEYTDKVKLIMKGLPSDISRENDKPFNIEEVKKDYKKIPEIQRLSILLPQSEFIWGVADIYLGLSRMEGFGLPIMRMQALGKEVVVLDNEFSGYNEYLDKSNAYFIPTKQVLAVEEKSWFYNKDTNTWVEPSIDDTINKLKEVITNFNNNKKINDLSFDYTKFSIDTVYKQYYEILNN